SILSDFVLAELFVLGMAPRECQIWHKDQIWHKEQRETANNSEPLAVFPSPAICGNRGFPPKTGCRSLIILFQNSENSESCAPRMSAGPTNSSALLRIPHLRHP